MRVRAPQAALWRGQVYDTFDGTRWTASDETTRPLLPSSDDGSYGVGQQPDDGRSPYVLTHRVVQTFYVQTQQPNVLFTAADAQTVYFPAGELRADRYGSIRAPILLDPGLVYSVISQVPVVTAGELRSSSGTVSGFERYLQLPADLPSRDGALAARITAGLTTTYDKAAAVQTWLQTHTEYDLEAPPEPEGVDAVDHFLFETHRGFCEHIASAMVLLLRESGVPARFVVGFGAGDRNPLTGYFDVRESDAHAWVEVFYPGIGWMPYDPTFGVPNANPSAASRFIAPEVFRAVARWLSNALPEPVRRAAVATGRAIGRNALPHPRRAPSSCRLPCSADAPAAGAGSGRRRRSARPPPSRPWPRRWPRPDARARPTARRRSSWRRSPPTPQCRRRSSPRRAPSFGRSSANGSPPPGVSADEVAEAAAAAGRARGARRHGAPGGRASVARPSR